MERRKFLQTSAVAAVASRSVLGANDKVRMGLIGCGSRGNMVSGFFARQPDVEFVAACDVDSVRLDQTAPKLGAKVEKFGDYRRVIERKDVDALLITTPDHWHSPMTQEACAAGKDVYVEKPISNAIEPAQKMVEAARKYNRVVQAGLQQRQGEHFKEAAKLVQDGYLGKISHVLLTFEGGYTMVPQPNEAPPPTLDWEMFQGSAPKHPYSPSRRRWRAFYDYGGGLVTDWGVHLTDVAHWYMKADAKAPQLTMAVAQNVVVPNKDRDQVPDAFICSWQYDDFVMSFTNAVMPNPDFPYHGDYFFGEKGCLLVHRSGYMIRPNPPRRRPGGPEPPPPIEAKLRPFKEDYANDPDTIANVRNFLDCIKSRQRPTCDIEIGFHSTLPCLIALLSIQQGRAFTWDGKSAKAV